MGPPNFRLQGLPGLMREYLLLEIVIFSTKECCDMFFKSKKSKDKEAQNEAASARDAGQAPAAPSATSPPIPASASASEVPKKGRGDARTYSRGVFQAFGAVVAVCCRSRSHRARTLAEIEEMVRPAVLSGQFSLAQATHRKNGLVAPVAAVLWASVSESIDRRLSSGAPAKLQDADWKSGNIIWVVDAVGDNRMLNAMVKRLREKTWKGRLVKVRARTASGKVNTRILQPATN
jgi:hemolysin-activating ACP:hemolysin acyltransferase